MTEYTNAEKADMILAHGATDCNGRATQRLYAEKHPVRRTPAHTMFARLHQQLCGTGSFQKAARTELNEEIVLDMVETTPSLSTRGDHLIGPYILPGHLTGPRYLIFLEQVLPKLLDRAHVTAATRTSMWFQQDGAPAHFNISVRNHLDAVCGERWIGRGVEAASGTNSAREAARRLGLPPSSVHNILRRSLQLYPYKLQSCHELLPADTAQKEAFAKWAFSKMEQDPTWVLTSLWTYEAHFSFHGDVNNHNCPIWATSNPREYTQKPLHSPKGTAWCGFTGSFIIGPFSLKSSAQ
ncbi:uncharacterized protein TNCV_4032301 [Trichonephila clavipes]|nr:uncharacterized protein TNCV_4032301 [Trichonephila clavipes]